MRKTILIAVFLVLASGLSFSAATKIQVYQPAQNDSFTQDQVVTIKWRMKGSIPAMVKIQLMDQSGNVFVQAIAGGTQNKGSHNWRIPTNVNPGSYRVKVIAIGGNASALSGVFNVTQQVTWSAPGYAMIASLKVNQQSPTDSCVNTQHRVSINLPQGIQIWTTATSVIQPIQYKYRVELTNPENSHDYAIHDGNWTSQAILNLNPTYNQVLDKVFPNGVSGPQIPLSLQGRVSVWVKNGSQTEPPQLKEICIRLWL